MKIAAVAVISFFDNEIHQRIVRVKNEDGWKEAFKLAIAQDILGNPPADFNELIDSMPDELEDARTEFADGNMDLVVTFFEL